MPYATLTLAPDDQCEFGSKGIFFLVRDLENAGYTEVVFDRRDGVYDFMVPEEAIPDVKGVLEAYGKVRVGIA